MRTILVTLSVVAAIFALGVACGLLLRAPLGQPSPFRIRGVPGIGVGIGIDRPRSGTDRPAEAASGASDADQDWDTYDSGVANSEPA